MQPHARAVRLDALGPRPVVDDYLADDVARERQLLVGGKVSESSRDECSPSVDAVGRRMMWTDPVTQFIGV